MDQNRYGRGRRREPKEATLPRSRIRLCIRRRRQRRLAGSQAALQCHTFVCQARHIILADSVFCCTNRTENPYEAAQKFLLANDLPLSYLDEVVRFIERNTNGVSLGTGPARADPYTGGGAYRPAPVGGVGVAPPLSAVPPKTPVASGSSFPHVRLLSPLRFVSKTLTYLV